MSTNQKFDERIADLNEGQPRDSATPGYGYVTAEKQKAASAQREAARKLSGPDRARAMELADWIQKDVTAPPASFNSVGDTRAVGEGEGAAATREPSRRNSVVERLPMIGLAPFLPAVRQGQRTLSTLGNTLGNAYSSVGKDLVQPRKPPSPLASIKPVEVANAKPAWSGYLGTSKLPTVPERVYDNVAGGLRTIADSYASIGNGFEFEGQGNPRVVSGSDGTQVIDDSRGGATQVIDDSRGGATLDTPQARFEEPKRQSHWERIKGNFSQAFNPEVPHVQRIRSNVDRALNGPIKFTTLDQDK